MEAVTLFEVVAAIATAHGMVIVAKGFVEYSFKGGKKFADFNFTVGEKIGEAIYYYLIDESMEYACPKCGRTGNRHITKDPKNWMDSPTTIGCEHPDCVPDKT